MREAYASKRAPKFLPGSGHGQIGHGHGHAHGLASVGVAVAVALFRDPIRGANQGETWGTPYSYRVPQVPTRLPRPPIPRPLSPDFGGKGAEG